MRKQLPLSLRALGREHLPETLALADGTYQFVRLFKHDFFAVTALYACGLNKAVLKIGRMADFLGLPCSWIGRLLTDHEVAAYRRLADLDAVPRFLGRWGKHGFAHAYVEGHALKKGERVPDEFFTRLREAIGEIHRRAMAYVDLEKPQNVIVGDDGRPYLIDFQIAWHWPREYGGSLWPALWLLRRLQGADRYHLLKLQRRTRPDQLTPEQIAASYHRPWYIRLHRWVTQPAMRIRRRTLDRLDPERGCTAEAGLVSVRRQPSRRAEPEASPQDPA